MRVHSHFPPSSLLTSRRTSVGSGSESPFLLFGQSQTESTMPFQYPLEGYVRFSERCSSSMTELASDIRFFPFSVVCVSCVLWSILVVRKSLKGYKMESEQDDMLSEPPNEMQTRITKSKTKFQSFIDLHGGGRATGFKIAHLMSCISLFFFDVLTPGEGSCHAFFTTITFFYASVLSFISLGSKQWGSMAVWNYSLILLCSLGVYVYRDVWPLLTYNQVPADTAEGQMLWAKIAILTAVVVVIPMSKPRRYVPVDPENSMPTPNPEQTASWFSKLTFSYIDHIVATAYGVAHLGCDQLPPLSDDDASKYQTKQSFKYLDKFHGAADRHIIFGLLYYFRWHYLLISLDLFLIAGFSFFAPLGLNKTLAYLEHGTQSSIIRPWVWISMLVTGPVLQSVFEHNMLYFNTRIRVNLEAICTQLVFEHSLRVRAKADVSEVKVGSEIMSGSNDENAQRTNRRLSAINNLVTSDLVNITAGLDFLNLFIQIPLQTILAIVFLYQLLGWSAIFGVSATILFVPVQRWFAREMERMQKSKMRQTDARVQTITEALSALRMVKMFGWEKPMSQRVGEKREEELKYLWRSLILRQGNSAFTTLIPTTTTLVTYLTYTLIMKQELNASKIFSSMAVFSMLRLQLERLSWRIPLVVNGKVSLDRLDDFLKNSELLDSYDTFKDSQTILVPSSTCDPLSEEIGFENATFSWSLSDAGSGIDTPSRRFRLHVEGKLLFKPQGINLIIGPTGSGKTSILMALLGEMHFIPTLDTKSWYNLPRSKGVAYAAQETWVENATIRENIVFGSPFDQDRYNKVIYQCALTHDFELFEAGDLTEVGERGLTLSGGQKARITLARAIYSYAQILLLDDVFAALDVHTSAWIAEHCFRGDLIRGRTVLLVTHNVALVGPISDLVVSIGTDGKIETKGTSIPESLLQNTVQAVEPVTPSSSSAKSVIPDQPISEGKSVNGKLVVAEEIAQGHVTWKSMKLFLLALDEKHPILFFTIWLSAVALESLVFTLQLWFLGQWGTQYELHPPSEVQVSFYLALYTSIAFANIGISFLATFVYNLGVVRSSKSIHDKLSGSVFGATLRWLDTTPTARVIARCTQDIGAIDSSVPQAFRGFVTELAAVITKLVAIVIFSPTFLLPGIVVALLGRYIGSLYLKAQLSVKREMSNSRSPLLSNFNAAIRGLISIRAYGAQEAFREESYKRIDVWSRASRVAWDLNRWVGFRIDVLGALFTCALAIYLVYVQRAGAAVAGFSLNNALGFCTYLFFLIRTFNDLEVQANSLERIQAYIDIEHEPSPTERGKPPAAWPTSGELIVENLSARYSPSGPKVLRDVSFHIKSGDRVGVVGRTGSGKSSLTLAILRCIFTEGVIYYDGIPTNSINLDALRSSISIIPQTPELLSGTLRQNLDPFEQNDDATLNDALRAAGLFSLQEISGEARYTLDTMIAGGGSNLSVGERQILALARAMIRGSKLLILDEATSAIDYKTDAIIQNTLRNQLGRDVTVITVAHRLQTIMDADKIMALDSGRLVEFDTPKNLLELDGSILQTLVNESSDKEILLELAHRKM